MADMISVHQFQIQTDNNFKADEFNVTIKYPLSDGMIKNKASLVHSQELELFLFLYIC